MNRVRQLIGAYRTFVGKYEIVTATVLFLVMLPFLITVSEDDVPDEIEQ